MDKCCIVIAMVSRKRSGTHVRTLTPLALRIAIFTRCAKFIIIGIGKWSIKPLFLFFLICLFVLMMSGFYLRASLSSCKIGVNYWILTRKSLPHFAGSPLHSRLRRFRKTECLSTKKYLKFLAARAQMETIEMVAYLMSKYC